MINFLLTCILLILGQCDIAPEHRIRNSTGSQCVWASLETIGRHFKIKELYGLTNEHKGVSGPGEVNQVLKFKGLKKWYWHPEGSKDWQGLKNAVGNHWPVAVGLSGTHMLLVVDVTKDKVRIIDNCGPDALKERDWDRNRFDSAWDGWMVSIPPIWSDVLWKEGMK